MQSHNYYMIASTSLTSISITKSRQYCQTIILLVFRLRSEIVIEWKLPPPPPRNRRGFEISYEYLVVQHSRIGCILFLFFGEKMSLLNKHIKISCYPHFYLRLIPFCPLSFCHPSCVVDFFFIDCRRRRRRTY